MNPYNFGSPWGRPRFSAATNPRNGMNYGNFSDASPAGNSFVNRFTSPSQQNMGPSRAGPFNRFSAQSPGSMSPYEGPGQQFSPARYSPYGAISTPTSSRGGASASCSYHSSPAASTPYQNNSGRFNEGGGSSARGSGRGRGFSTPHNASGSHHRSFNSPAHRGGSTSDISEYYHPSMLRDPWAALQNFQAPSLSSPAVR